MPEWLWYLVAGVPAVMWMGVLLVPWQPWRNRERLAAASDPSEVDGSSVTVLIPARDEADVIGGTLRALAAQGSGLRVIVIDDGSTDGTAAIARAAMTPAGDHGSDLEVITGAELAPGWSGKLWALEQGRRLADREWILLLDADIELDPGTLAALLRIAEQDHRDLVSVMALLAGGGFWERLLHPPFVYYFRLLYPFALSNGPSRRFAAAAGGCILVRRRALEAIGGLEALREALIDDCTLARCIKQAGYRTWIGVSRGVRSARSAPGLRPIWNMVARTAFTQLHYSWLLLMLCTLLMLVAYWAPVAALAAPTLPVRAVAGAALVAMVVAVQPTLRLYRRSPLWGLLQPVVGTLFLAMTWTSALRHLRGIRSQWKGRVYQTGVDPAAGAE